MQDSCSQGKYEGLFAVPFNRYLSSRSGSTFVARNKEEIVGKFIKSVVK